MGCSSLGNFSFFFVVCQFFSKSNFFEKNISGIDKIRVSNSVDLYQVRPSVEPDLGSN